MNKKPPYLEQRSVMRLASAGFELASFPLILGAVGYFWIDPWLGQRLGNATPFVAIAGVLIGFCLGFYRLIVLANRMQP